MRRNASTKSVGLEPALIFAPFVFLFILVILAINSYYFHFQGNDYLPEGVLQAGLSLYLVNIGLRCFLHKNHYCCELAKSILLIFSLMILVALLTNAVQLTPFPPIDKNLLIFEQKLHINLPALIAWTKSHLSMQKLLALIYDSLAIQMSVLPLAMAIFGKFEELKTYCSLMLISALIGFGFYYFFPTTAPASVIDIPLFSADQYATGIKFNEIHHHLLPSTMEGGLISLPSFHAIWAWLCLYLVRSWTVVFYCLLPINVLLVASCVLLGWHYLLDIVAAGLVVYLSHRIHQYLRPPIEPDYYFPENRS